MSRRPGARGKRRKEEGESVTLSGSVVTRPPPRPHLSLSPRVGWESQPIFLYIASSDLLEPLESGRAETKKSIEDRAWSFVCPAPSTKVLPPPHMLST